MSPQNIKQKKTTFNHLYDAQHKILDRNKQNLILIFK